MAGDRELDSLVSRLTARELPALAPARVYDIALTARIDGLEVPPAVRAVLHLMNDDIARAHAIAQSGEGDATLDYVHAIVHRREGDWANSKYWFSRAGGQPVVRAVYGPERGAAALFVDRCRTTAGDAKLEEEQWRELRVLLDYTRGATRAE
jgi:hypothetical protein